MLIIEGYRRRTHNHMNFQKLRSVRETVRQGFNLTLVAEALHTAQPGVSRQRKEFEANWQAGQSKKTARSSAMDAVDQGQAQSGRCRAGRLAQACTHAGFIARRTTQCPVSAARSGVPK